MERADVLRDLAKAGVGADPKYVVNLATEVGMLASDLLVVAGHPVPAALLPPQRDAKVLKEFAYRASYCNHGQMAELEDFIRALPAVACDSAAPCVEPRKVYARPEASRFAVVLDGLMANRGFGPRELPFMVLSLSTIRAAVGLDQRDEHRWPRLDKLAGPLGWMLEDLLSVADEPSSTRPRWAIHCHHLGRVYMAAIPLTTAQLVEAGKQADRLSARPDQGAWRPVSQGFAKECPDLERSAFASL